MNLYKEALTDHYRNPRNRGILWGGANQALQVNLKGDVVPPILGVKFASELHNPSCGDSISWQGYIQKDRVTAIAFEGKGCVISQGAASMLSEKALEMTLDQIVALQASFMLSLIGLELGPTRARCALLPLEALQQGIDAHKKSTTHNS